MAGCSLAAHAHVHWQLASGFVPIWASGLTKLSQGQVFHRGQCERRSQWRSSLFVGRQAAAVFAFVIVADALRPPCSTSMSTLECSVLDRTCTTRLVLREDDQRDC